ncbi:MAG: metal ABC transporter substrate-binding protein [Nocardioides sp.]
MNLIHRRAGTVMPGRITLTGVALTGVGLTGGAMLLAGCGAFAEEPAGEGVVAAAFYPLEYAAARVAADHLTVESLTTPGVEPHDLELGIGETAVVSDADLVVYQRGFQPAVDETVDNTARGVVLDAAQAVSLVSFADHGEEGSGAEHEGHENGETDPHFWLDPLLMADLGDALATSMAETDPAHADDYAVNTAALRDDLETLDGEYAAGLASCERDTVVVSHDAFGYLSRYGLHFESIAGLSPDSEPTPADLSRLGDLIRTEGITTVFSETLIGPALADTLAGDLGIRSAVLDPLEGLGDTSAGEDYLSLMRSNLTALELANGCAP